MPFRGCARLSCFLKIVPTRPAQVLRFIKSHRRRMLPRSDVPNGCGSVPAPRGYHVRYIRRFPSSFRRGLRLIPRLVGVIRVGSSLPVSGLLIRLS